MCMFVCVQKSVGGRERRGEKEREEELDGGDRGVFNWNF